MPTGLCLLREIPALPGQKENKHEKTGKYILQCLHKLFSFCVSLVVLHFLEVVQCYPAPSEVSSLEKVIRLKTRGCLPSGVCGTGKACMESKHVSTP